MADEKDFCGVRLRLTALLRVAENIPQRPARLRRRLANTDEQNQAIENAPPSLNVSLDRRPSIAYTPSQPSTTAATANETILEHRLDKPSASGLDLSPSKLAPLDSDNGLLANKPKGPSASTSDTPKARSSPVHVQTPFPKVHSGRGRKKPKQITNGSSHGLPSARQRKRLSINELALVRTSTENGLPSPGEAGSAYTPAITDTDPIEDIRADIHQSVSERLPRSVPNSSKGSPTRTPYSCGTSLGGYRIEKSNLQLAQSNVSSRRQGIRKCGFDTLADGFEAMEISLYSKILKTRPARKRGGAKYGRKEVRPGRQLQLAGGVLPDPLLQSSTSIRSFAVNPSISASTLQFSPDAAPTLSTTSSVLPVNVSGPESIDVQYSHIDRSITAQFSRITAPAREISCTESDSDADSVATSKMSGSTLGLGEEVDEDGAGSAYEVSDTLSAAGTSMSRPASSDTVRRETSYFGEAIFHLSPASDKFASHYEGMY